MPLINIKLRNCCQNNFVDTNDVQVETNTYYLIETENGLDIGCTCRHIKDFPQNEVEKTGKILNRASEDDISKIPEILALENKAYHICKKKIAERKLDMKLVSVKSIFDKSKIVFYFVAENRIDFRELVRDLASVFKTRIEMRQIGVRDETKFLGGFGLCGRELCCGFLSDGFDPVSIKMAKEQNLNLNSLKISGMCGRLLCCLSYEYGMYKDLNKGLPSVDTEISIGGKVFRVVAVDTLKSSIRLKNESLIVDVSRTDIQKNGDKFIIKEEVLEKIRNSNAKDNSEPHDEYSY